MFEKPVLLYSDHCNHCVQLINQMSRIPGLLDSFDKLNIDVNSSTKQRPDLYYKIQTFVNNTIKQVPTILITDNNELFVLQSQDAFKWVESLAQQNQHSKQSQQQNQKRDVEVQREVSSFNPNEMGSFSDGYSKFGSNELNDATEQNFKFFDKDTEGNFILPSDSFEVSGEIKGPDAFKEKFENVHSNQTAQQPKRNLNNTSDNSIPNASQLDMYKSTPTLNKSEADKRYAELLEQRKNI